MIGHLLRNEECSDSFAKMVQKILLCACTLHLVITGTSVQNVANVV